MATLQTSGAISLNDIKTLFGGPTSPSLANYYRGGSYIPATKIVISRTPTTGEYFSFGSYIWSQIINDNSSADTPYILWNGVNVSGAPANATSYTTGGYTYYRGSLYTSAYYPPSSGGYGSPPTPGYTVYYYYIYRTSSSTVDINTSIPTSGTISLSQFYGAEKP